ncbi:FIST N-terminal domain-containing protein [Sphingomonas immobilis]|uniref:FIST N-terminal domain-containing protein n=1 Tax=Sphingomonas immobilis TaxID=3063997 RepID=A0ABT9A247_9SPHN|nr:FIST N-terminal domain-containing protein [Sphingomonas sp. CA1-15]MDO7843912.1 FIST N-terminal domain-containing protein [Sphingomonas sp. CA1-15]
MMPLMVEDKPAATRIAHVRTAATRIDDPDLAAQALFAELDPTTLSGVIVFSSSRYDLEALAHAINRRSEGLCVVGCTSSGEITPEGIAEGTITAIGFPASDFALTAVRFEDLDAFDPSRAQGVVRGLVANAAEQSRRLGTVVSRAAIFLVDGLSHREEMLTVTVQDALGDIPLIGGSSGDGLDFRETFIFQDGAFRRDAALVAILSSVRPMKVFRSQHYAPGGVKMVITGADPANRIVTEINAEPAAQEYARLAGITTGVLGPSVFSSHPPMVRAGGEYYVRSIQSANPDGSLTFYCAIDEGVVLTLGEAQDIVDGLTGLFDDLDASVGGIDRILGFDCVLNKIEAEQRQLTRIVSKMFVKRRVTGFNTYGEQFHALHVNQTFSGLAIGRGD